MARSGKVRNIKFWKYYKEWVETYKLGAVRQSTYVRYLSYVDVLKAYVPDLELGSMTRTDAQMFINRYGEHHRKGSVICLYRLIHPALQDAVYEGWVKKDPFYRIRITSQVPEKKRKKWLEEDEAAKLEQVLKHDQSGFGDWYDFALRTGLRFGEMCGLTPADVDQDNMTIDINKAWDYKYGKGFDLTKNTYSNRVITIDPQALADLQRHLAECGEHDSIVARWYYEQHKHKNFRKTKGWQKKVHNSVFNGRLARMCEQAGVHRVSMHGLRHTHASLLIANRVSIQSVAKRLGHANTTITQKTYIHLLDKLAMEDNQKIMNVMKGL